MKRIKSACIMQTLQFLLKKEIPHETAVRQVKEEVEHYKELLDKNHTKYRITDETTNPYGSVTIKVIKQYGMSPVGDYLN